MNVYRPPQREVSAWVLSVARWMRCTFHPPEPLAFDDYLDQGRAFLPLTDVAIAPGAPLLFLALRTSAAHVVVPDAPEEHVNPEPRSGTVRQVTVYVGSVAVHGALHLRPGIRTSDFLVHHEGWVALRGCRMMPPVPGMVEPLRIAFVNVEAIVAVAEEGGEGGVEDAPFR